MLYNKNWDYKVKADPFSLESLIAWLETKPALEEYCFFDNGRCLLGQFALSFDTGAENPTEWGMFEYRINGARVDFFGFRKVAQGAGDNYDWTFGAALERARAALTP